MSNNKLEVERSVLVPILQEVDISVSSKHIGISIWPVNTVYVPNEEITLLQDYGVEVASDTFGKFFRRWSRDNGLTWSEPSVIFEPDKRAEGIHRMGETCLFVEPENGKVIHFYNLSIYPDISYSGDVARLTRIFYTISDDGKKFGESIQLIQKGFDEKNWAQGVIYGENCIAISFCAPVKLSNGKILLPAMLVPIGADLSNPFLIQDEACCFIGTWKDEAIEWELGNLVKIDPALSTRGLDEPTVAELSDGDILMVCRGSNSTATHLPGRRWYSFSQDKGSTWSEVYAMKYDSGEDFFSPATGSRLIRHSGNGKLYWIGNISPENPDGNRPRYPLVVAEVDEEKRGLIKDTVFVIEDKRPKDSPFVQFSNFRVYEDKVTGDLLVTLARIQSISEKDLSSPAYQHRIKGF